MNIGPDRSAVHLVMRGMQVIDIHGKALGTVTDADYEEQFEQLMFVTVQHGLLGRKHKTIPAHLVKQVAKGIVTLKFSKAEFKELGDAEAHH